MRTKLYKTRGSECILRYSPQTVADHWKKNPYHDTCNVMLLRKKPNKVWPQPLMQCMQFGTRLALSTNYTTWTFPLLELMAASTQIFVDNCEPKLLSDFYYCFQNIKICCSILFILLKNRQKLNTFYVYCNITTCQPQQWGENKYNDLNYMLQFQKNKSIMQVQRKCTWSNSNNDKAPFLVNVKMNM